MANVGVMVVVCCCVVFVAFYDDEFMKLSRISELLHELFRVIRYNLAD